MSSVCIVSAGATGVCVMSTGVTGVCGGLLELQNDIHSFILRTQAPVKIQRLLQNFLRNVGVKDLELYNLLYTVDLVNLIVTICKVKQI